MYFDNGECLKTLLKADLREQMVNKSSKVGGTIETDRRIKSEVSSPTWNIKKDV